MGGIKKCSLFVALSVLFLTVFSIVFSNKTYAASEYDGVVKTTLSLSIQYTGQDSVDVSTNFIQYLKNGYPGGTTSTCDDDCNTLINDSLDHGDWFLSTTNSTYPTDNTVVQVYYCDKKMTATFETYGSSKLLISRPIDGTSTNCLTGTIQYQSVSGTFRVAGSTNISNLGGFVIGNGTTDYNIFLYTGTIVYPDGYEGQHPSDHAIDELQHLKPNYSWQVSKDGVVHTKYLQNLPHFLTGIGNVVLTKMTDNWGAIDSQVDTIESNPAGWLDDDFTNHLPSPGYYMLRFDHNQQLDSPPWPVDSSQHFYIDQRWVQFYWDGTKALNGTTTGCTDDICNDQKAKDNPTWNLFKSLDNVNTYGLQSFLIAPITFFQTLPSKVNACAPITFPLMGTTLTLPCMKTMYWDWNATIMDMYTAVVNGLVAYLVAVNIFRNVKNINSPHKDQIEVAKL